MVSAVVAFVGYTNTLLERSRNRERVSVRVSVWIGPPSEGPFLEAGQDSLVFPPCARWLASGRCPSGKLTSACVYRRIDMVDLT